MSLPQLDALLLDLDGTLVDTNRLNRSAWKASLAERGLEMTDVLYARIVGTHVELVNEVFGEVFGKDVPFAELLQRRLELAREIRIRDGIAPMPGARELLDWARGERIRCAVATTTAREIAEDIVIRAGLRDGIELVIGGDEVPQMKPAPDIYLECARRLGVAPSRCFVVEDTSAGAAAGRAAGMPYAVVPDLTTPTAEIAAGAATVCGSLHELLAWLKANLVR